MKKHLIKSILLVVLVCIGMLLPHSQVFAKSPVWVTLGVGPGEVEGGSLSWMGSRLAVSWCKGAGLWTIATSSCAEFKPLSSMEPLEAAYDLGVLYGKRWSKPGLGFVSISGGIAFVHGMRRGEFITSTGSFLRGTTYYEKLPYSTVGIPVDVQLARAGRKFGLALDLFGNLNSERSYGAATISLIIGRLWQQETK